MKKLLLLATLACISAPSMSDTYVRGHVRQDGTYVQPHYRSDSNSTKSDNYSTEGNTNPYTDKTGNESAIKGIEPLPSLPSLHGLSNGIYRD